MKEVGQVVPYCETYPVLGPIPPKYPPLMDLINSFANNVSKLVQADQTPSLSVNLIYDQDILWSQGYGLKNLSEPTSVPNGDTPYQIGSITKVFTTLLALIAQDAGKLSFTDEVSSYVPEFSPVNPFPTKRSINFNQLASHMAGMPRECPCQALQSNCNLSNEEMWPRIQNITLVTPPGTAPQYSNAGFACLGHVVETILNDEWPNMIHQEILGPLGMNFSGANITDDLFLMNRAVGYTTGNQVSDMLNIGWESPAGGMYSTTNDLAKFISFFFRDDVPYMAQPDQILDGMSIREWRQPRFINIDLTGFGLPWEIYNSPIIYTKGGAMYGYLSLIITVPVLKLGMVILQSSDAVLTINEVFATWASNFITPFAQILQAVSPAPYIPSNFNFFVGTYSMDNNTVEISVVQTTQYPVPVINALGLTMPLYYFSANTFRIDPTKVLMSCNLQQSGMEQYIVFYPTTPPSFEIPGLYPDIFAYMTSK